MLTNRTILWLIAAVVLLVAVFLYRCCFSGTHVNVEPHAAEEIDKAKRR